MSSHARVARGVTAGLVAAGFIISTAGVATADEPNLDSVEEIVETVTGESPDVLTDSVAIGDILDIESAPEVDTTYVVDDGDTTSVVASIEEPDIDEVSFDLGLDDGYSLYLTEDGGGFILDEAQAANIRAAGESAASGTNVDVSVAVAATLDAPWAVDAEGNDVPTWYEVQGDTLVQHVDTSEATLPVAADPGFSFGWKWVTPVIYYRYSWSQTTSIATYVPSRLSAVGWLCDGLPGPAVSPCRALVAGRANDLVSTAKSAVRNNKCLGVYQGFGSGISVFFYDAYTTKC